MELAQRKLSLDNLVPDQVIGIPVSSEPYLAQRLPKRLLPGPANNFHFQPSTKARHGKVESVFGRVNKLGEKVENLAQGIREHVRLSPKITETVKGKFRLGAKILQVGGVERVFKQVFKVRDGEKLIKASQCYLFTTAGPIAGLLFISSDKVAFCSERSIKVSSPSGELHRVHYKVMIPLKKIKIANESENVKKPSRKYIKIVTKDDFEFWFMGFLNHHKTLKHLQWTISQAQAEF